jgi:subtilisin-like proprotein convertase family protein
MRKTLLAAFAVALGSMFFAASASAATFDFTSNSVINPGDNTDSTTSTLEATTFGKITRVTVGLTNVSHTRPADFDVIVKAPTGEFINLMSDNCGATTISNYLWTFSDDALVQMGANLLSCDQFTYKPSENPADTDHWAGLSGITRQTTFASLNGKSGTGDWKLYIADDTAGETGTIGSWNVHIETDGVDSTRIPDSGSSGTAELSKTIGGFSRTISDVDVILNDVEHTYPEDLDIVAQSPAGTKVTLASDICSDTTLQDTSLAFDDEAASPPPYETECTTPARFKPTDYDTPVAAFPNGVTGPFASALSAFDGQSANGMWKLYFYDKANGDYGYIKSFDLAVTMRGAKPEVASNPTLKFKKSGKKSIKLSGRVSLAGEALSAAECAGTAKSTFANKVVKKKKKKKVTSYSKVVATNSPLTFAGTSCGFDISAKVPKKYSGKKLRLVTQYLGGEFIAPFTTTSTEKIKKLSFK